MASNPVTLTTIPGWTDLFTGQTRINDTIAAYAFVPLFRRCVDLRANALSSVPILLTRGSGNTPIEFGDPGYPFKTDLEDLIWRTEAGLLMSGAGYWEKGAGAASGRVRDVRWVNPWFVTVVPQSGGALSFAQAGQTWTADQMVYFHEWNPAYDVLPGPSVGQAALENARLMHYATRMGAKFFENGAIFPTLLNFEYPPEREEAERVENWFRRLATGINNAFRVLALRSGKTTATTLMSPVKDLAIPELTTQARQAFAHAFGIPQTMLDDAASYATASQHDAQFWEDTVRPRGEWMEGIINEQLLEPLGYEMEFDFESLTVFQEDENTRAVSLGQLTTAGLPLLMAMDILGYDLSEEQRAELEQAAADKQAQAQALRDNLANAAKNPPPQPDQQPADNQPPAQQPGQPLNAKSINDLDTWRQTALRFLGKGKAIPVDWECKALDEATAAPIRAKLREAKTAEDIEAAFEIVPQPADPMSALVAELRRANDLLAAAV